MSGFGSSRYSKVCLRCGVVVLLVGACAGFGDPSGAGQGAHQSVTPPPPVMDPGSVGTSADRVPGFNDADPLARTRVAGQARALANDRQKKLMEDTEKLVALANELQTEVNKTTKNDLSLTVIKKAGEIEKLAHDVKERERN